MLTVYVLRSLINRKRYIGHTGLPASMRLFQHNNNTKRWTGRNGPFRIIHTEGYETRAEAMRREKFLKSGQGRKWLDDNIKE